MSERYSLSRFKLLWIFESKIRPLWGYLPADMAARITAVHEGHESKLVITRADFDRIADIAWGELIKQLRAE
jgi:hypothetical protein